MTKSLSVIHKQRINTASNWTTANPVLAAGQLGIESDTRKLKVGDGVTTWNSLHYAAFETVLSTTNPAAQNSGYAVGTIWVNTTTSKAFVCLSGGTSAIWALITPTKGDVGLGNVDNTSDANKPVSTAMQTALNGKLNTSSFVGSTFTANVIPLDNPLGSFRVATASNVTTYTLSTTKVIGAWAKILINLATEPAVTGGTLIKGSDFKASTNMYLYVSYDGTKSEYYFAEI